MIAHLRPYPRLKDSGVDWLKVIPAHWDVRRIKTPVCREKGCIPKANRRS